MKSLLIALILMSSAQAATFNRFWVGFKKTDVTTEKFLTGLNQIFFQKTIDVGLKGGLLAYQPYISKMNGDVPDELALVTYESEAQYRAVRATPEGTQYSDMHWDYFNKEVSKSTVTQKFSGTLKINEAFELNPQDKDWQKHKTLVLIYSTKGMDLKKLSLEFGRLNQNQKLKNAAIIVMEKWVIEYRSYSEVPSSAALLSLPLLEKKELKALRLAGKKTYAGFGEGVNFNF